MRVTAVVGGTLIDGTGKAPIPDSVVLVRGERISNVFRRGEQPIPPGSDVIEAAGKTVFPGLIDAHVHVGQLPHNRFDVEQPDDLCDRFLRWFTAQGVTTVRDTGSPALDESLRTLKAGRPDWPRVYSAGPNLDGPPGGPWPGLRVVASPADAREQTADLIDGGADFIKVYVWMTEEVLRAVVATAHERGVRVAGHVGHVLTVEEAVRVGVDALEHVRVGRELLTDGQRATIDALPPRRNDHLFSFRPWRLIDLNTAITRAFIDLLVERGVFLTPTLALSRAVLRTRDPAIRDGPGVSEMDEAIQQRWASSDYTADYSDEDWRFADVELSRQLEFIGLAHQAGVRITAGTDTPNPFLAPGFSLHQELRLLVEAGLTPADAIVSATLRPAQLLGIGGQLGSLEKGKLADLVVVAGDLAVDIDAVDRVGLVMKAGDVLFRDR